MWGHAALLAGRNIPIYMLVAAPVVAVALKEWLAALDGAALAGWLRRAAGVVRRMNTVLGEGEKVPRLHLVSGLAVAMLAAVVYAPAPPRLFKSEYDRKAYPAAAIESGMVAGAGTRVFTSDEWGDYLIYRLYPRTKVFIDGRSDFYGEEFGNRFLDVWGVKYDWEQTLGRYGVNTVLLPPGAALAGALKESRRWRVVYDDGVALVFRQAGAPPAPGIQVSAADGSSGVGRDREITKTRTRDREITQSQTKPKT